MRAASIPSSVWALTALLALSTLLSSLDQLPWVVHVISLAGPAGIVWMVVHVLRDHSVAVRDLADDEQWGYQDRPDLRPGS